MENPASSDESYTDTLLVLTSFISVLDIITFHKVGLLAEGWKHLTEGDMIAIGVLLVFTVVILLVDMWRIFIKKGQKSKQVLFEPIKFINVNEKCPVCLETEGREAVQIKCGHAFHRHCIQQCIDKEHLSCPVCRARIQ